MKAEAGIVTTVTTANKAQLRTDADMCSLDRHSASAP
jgi:hypothetical protein